MKKTINIGSRGDTIIEVLLAIAVLSSILSISYGLANRSSQTNIQSQERSEAQKFSEEQLELLRGYVSPDRTWDNNNNFCFTSGSNLPTSNLADCQSRGSGGRYNVRITASGNVTEGYTYTINSTWNSARGGIDQLVLSYKLPATGNIPSVAHSLCNDGVDNDGDGTADYAGTPAYGSTPAYPADPDCAGDPNGTSELTPPPPPPPPPPPDECPNNFDFPGSQSSVPYGFTKDASGNCVPLPYRWLGVFFSFWYLSQYPGIENNATCSSSAPKTCFLTSFNFFTTGMSNWSSPVTMTYDLTKNTYVPPVIDNQFNIVQTATILGDGSVPSGEAQLRIDWFNDPAESLPPPSNYRPQVRIRINTSSGEVYNPCFPTDYCLLTQPRHMDYMIDIFTINVPEGAESMTIEWINDTHSTTYDANIGFIEAIISRN